MEQYTISNLLKNLQKNMHLEINDSEMLQLKEKKNILLIKSAKDDVAMPIMEYLEHNDYSGNIYMIGRKEDEAYKLKYPNLKLDIFVVETGKIYSVQNTYEYTKDKRFDAAVFLCRTKVTLKHDNLISIIAKLACECYAVGLDLCVKQLGSLEDYQESRDLYGRLIEWLYEHDLDEV